MEKDSIELELKVYTKELDETLKKAKELKNTLEEVKNLINSIANNQHKEFIVDGKEISKVVYSAIRDTFLEDS